MEYLASRATQSAEIHIPPASEGLEKLGLPSGTGFWVIYVEAVGQDHEWVRAEELQSAFLRTGKALCRRDQGRFGDQSWTSLVPGPEYSDRGVEYIVSPKLISGCPCSVKLLR